MKINDGFEYISPNAATWESTEGEIAWCYVIDAAGKSYLRFSAPQLSDHDLKCGDGFTIEASAGCSWVVHSTDVKNLSIMED